ncbi:hypothetical protein MNEG_10578, partial [Monoraphidium neglectum]
MQAIRTQRGSLPQASTRLPPLVPRPPPLPRRRVVQRRPRGAAGAVDPAHGAAGADGVANGDGGGDNAVDGIVVEFSHNVFEALPPPPNVGRKRQVAALVAGAMIEFTATGAVVWAPLAAALAVILLAPSRRQLQQREAEVAALAAERARVDLLSRMPVTPAEAAQCSAEAVSRPQARADLLAGPVRQAAGRSAHVAGVSLAVLMVGCAQDAIANAAPRGWTLAISDVSLGTDAVQLSDFQAYGDPATGRLTAVDCRMVLNSDTMKVVVRGSSPIAAFTATVSGIRMAGDLRITPRLDQRILLWGFKRAPSTNVKLAVKGPIGGADLSQFQFIQAVATTINLHIESLVGLPRTLGRRRATTQLAVVAVENISKQRAATARELAVGPGSRQVAVMETVKLELPRKEGLVRLELRDLSAGGRRLGTALLWVSAAPDGSTLFWGHSRSGEALARRWGPSDRPWRVSLPLEGEGVGRLAEVKLGVGVEPWTYKQPLVPTSYRSTGPHTVVLQVVEARYLGGQPGPPPGVGSNPFVQLQYDQSAYATAVAYGTTSPVFLETFAFAENASMLTRRVRLEAWSAPPA